MQTYTTAKGINGIAIGSVMDTPLLTASSRHVIVLYALYLEFLTMHNIFIFSSTYLVASECFCVQGPLSERTMIQAYSRKQSGKAEWQQYPEL